MRLIAIWLMTGVLLGFTPVQAGESKQLPVTFEPPISGNLASFTLVDWVNGLAFDLDPRTRVVVQPHCNLFGGFILAWPEADTDCDPEALFEPEYELEVSAYHSYIMIGISDLVDSGLDMLSTDEIGGQEHLDKLQLSQLSLPDRQSGGYADVHLEGGDILNVPFYTWQDTEATNGLGYLLEYVVWQPYIPGGMQIITVTLRSTTEPSQELIELATSRLRLFTPPQV